jgi:amino acid transporter
MLTVVASYRQNVHAYPSGGGDYEVATVNLGPRYGLGVASALLVDYVLTVAVSISSGVANLGSVLPFVAQHKVGVAIAAVALLTAMNLRGIRESGTAFAVPTYAFMVVIIGMVLTGLFRIFVLGDDLKAPSAGLTITQEHAFTGAAMAFLLLRAFSSGSAALTGVEAISNGVPAFRQPAWQNARKTLVMMGTGLGVMFLGLSALVSHIKVAPMESGSPTVIAQVGDAVFGHGPIGNVLFYSLQAGTMLILIMAANTGFADFPRLASFQAGDSFLPRQLTKRGHRLVYSNGIIALAGAAMALVLITGGEVSRLIPLYAIGVFTGFTLSQSGMTKHHLRKREPGWQKGVLVNGFGAFLSGTVALIIAVTKFSEGAWFILIVLPVMVLVFLRLNRQYTKEAHHLEADVPGAATAKILRRHVVLVFVDRLDLASARAIQYARTLTPDELRAVHFVIDDDAARHLAEEWGRLGLRAVSLELVECPDRRLTRTAVETVARELSDGETEVSVLLPDRKYRGLWHRILHDRTSESIQAEVSRLPHANVTAVPFHFDSLDDAKVPLSALVGVGGNGRHANGPRVPGGEAALTTPGGGSEGGPATVLPGCHPIADVRYRDRVRVGGRVRSVRVAPQHDAPVLELVLDDGTAALSVVFLGRRSIGGVRVGTKMVVEGTVGLHRNRLAMLNPTYELRS